MGVRGNQKEGRGQRIWEEGTPRTKKPVGLPAGPALLPLPSLAQLLEGRVMDVLEEKLVLIFIF